MPDAALPARVDSLINIIAKLTALIPLTQQSPVAQIDQSIFADGNPTNPFAAAQAINNLSNVTITSPTITGLSASAIPDLSSTYLSTKGGAVSGSLSVSGTISGTVSASSSSLTNLTATNATSTSFFATNASTTNATSTNLFAAIVNFTTGIISTLSGTELTYTAASTTNVSASGEGYFGTASTTNLTVSGAPSGFLQTNAQGIVSATSTFSAGSLFGTLGVGNGGTGSTTLTGILKGNGTGAIQSAIGGTDYEFPLTFSTGLNRIGNTVTNTGVLSIGIGYATTTGTAISFSTTTQAFNGLTIAQQITSPNGSNILFTPNISGTLNNSGLTNFSITFSSPNSTLSAPGSIALGGTANFDLNLTHSNWWTATQNFTNASTSEFTATSSVWFTSLTNALLATDQNGKLISTTTIGTNLLSANTIALSNGGGLTISGSPIALGGTGTLSLDLTHANSWTGLQQFTNASTTLFSAYGPAYFGATATSSFGSNGALTLATALTVGNGGTGQTSFTAGNLLYGAGSGAVQNVATSSVTAGTGVTFSGTAGSLVGGTNLTINTPWTISGSNIYNNTSGNVGIAGASTGAKLGINVSSADGISITTSASSTLLFTNETAGGWNPLVQLGDSLLLSHGSSVDGADAPGIVIGPWSNSAKGIRIAPSGNVGIGTAAPIAPLSVGYLGASSFTNNASSTIFGGYGSLPGGLDAYHWVSEFRSSASGNTDRLLIGQHRTAAGSDWTTAAWRIQPAVDNSYTGMSGNQGYVELSFGTAGSYHGIGLSGQGNTTPDVIINGSGNVGIGTTTPLGLLHLENGSVTQYRLYINDTRTDGSTGSGEVVFNRNMSAVGSITTSPTATSYNTTSDRRLKENIATTTLGLTQLMQLPVRSFDFIKDPTHATTTGFIAQELYPVFPWAVTTNSDNGTVPLGPTSTPWSVDYGRITPLIVKAVQDIADISSTFQQNLIAWLGNAENGIHALYAGIIHSQEDDTQKLCVGSVCVTPQQFAAMVAAANQSSSAAPSNTAQSATSSAATSSPDTPPIIQINGDNPAIIHVGDVYNDLSATIIGPQADLNLGIKTFLNGQFMSNIAIDTSTAATDTIDYVVTNQHGLTSTSTRMVIIEPTQVPSVVPTNDTATTRPVNAATTSAAAPMQATTTAQ